MSSELVERLRINTIWSVLCSDVSWGTKGDNKVSMDLGIVNAVYEDAIHVLSTKPPKEDKKVDAATTQEDFYCNF